MAHNKERALEPIEFIQMLKLTDDFYGQPFVLLDWQHQILWDVYGTVNESGYRQYRFAYLEIPKKNGKTTLIASLAVYHLACDGPDGQIYCCAADRGQAELVYRAAISMIDQNADLQEIFKITDSKKEILNTITGTRLKVLSAEAYTKHGLNPTVVIFDELHAQPNRDLWDVMTFGAGAARKEPLWWVITTAGDDPDRHSIGWEQHEYARKVRDGELNDPSWYVKIYGAPEDADIFDEATWFAANPSLGKAIDIDSVRREALQAQNSESAEKLFRWLRLNQWVSIKTVGWQPLSLWDSTVGNWNRVELVGKYCYCGVDLSSTVDLTGMALIFPPQDDLDEWRFICEGWIPQDNMKERVRRDKVPYDRWVDQKYLHSTPGNVVDYDFVKARILAAAQQYELRYLGIDPWMANMLTQPLVRDGFNENQIIAIPQTMASMSPAMKNIEVLMNRRDMSHEKNPLARWCWGNVRVAVDGNENIKPMKNKSTDRIDLIVALVNGMAVASQMEEILPCAYEKRGIRMA